MRVLDVLCVCGFVATLRNSRSAFSWSMAADVSKNLQVL